MDLHPDPSHPYRAASSTGGTRRRRSIALLGVAAALSAYVLYRGNRPRPLASLAPTHAPSRAVVSLLEPELPQATPLAPLLAADGPGAPSLSLPEEGTTRVLRGRRLTLTFNRLMVPAERVGEPASAPIARFEPPVAGTFRWVTRSSATFEPEPAVWEREVDSLLSLDPSLRSLAGEAISAEGVRRAVFDGSARVDPSATSTRIPAGAPIAIGTTRDIAAETLSREMMVYEIGAAGRSVPFTLRRTALDAEGSARFELRLARSMDPGARVGVAFAPSRWPSLYPSAQLPNLEIEFEPPPQIDGVACASEQAEGGHEEAGCAFEAVPGAIVDIETVLRLRSSAPLGPVDASMVRVSPAVPGLSVRVARRMVELTADWAPDQVYELRLAGLRDARGAALRSLAPLAVRSRGMTPAIQMHEGLLTLERSAAPELPIAGVHTAEGQVWLRDVAAGEEERAVSTALTRSAPGEAARWRASALAASIPEARANRWARGRVRWDADAGRGQMRLLEVTADRVAGGASGRALVQRTDLGLHAQAMRDGVLVWATSIERATPIEGVEVRVSGAESRVARARTDASGLAWIARPGAVSADEALTVLASRGDDRSVLVLDPRRTIRPGGLGLSDGAAATPEAAAGGVLAMVFTDRGVVRPGERVHAVGVLRRRRADGLRAVGGRTMEVELMGPDGSVATARRRTSRFGSLSADFDVPRTARPGAYSVVLHEARAGRATVATSTIQVADHQPPRVRADLVLQGGDLGDGDLLRARIEARLLIGAPLRDAPVRWTITREGKATDPAGHGGFVFGLGDASSYPPVAATASTSTGVGGVSSAEIPLRSAYPQRERLRVEARVRDATGGETAATRFVTLRPADLEVGLRALPPWVPANTEVNPAAIVLRADGGAVSGQPVRLTIHREGWRAWWEREEGDAAHAEPAAFVARRAQQRTAEHTCALQSGVEPAACSWRPTQPGAFIVAAEVRDARGRVSVATQRVYVAGPGQQPDRDPPGASVTLTPQRSQLRAGETARIAVECPWPEAEALVTVSRAGLASAFRRRLVAGGNVLEVPTTAAMAPNAFVTVTLLRPRTGALRPIGDLDLDAPDLRWGATEIGVQPQVEQLAVEWTPPASLEASSARAESVLRVRDGEGRPVRAELTVYAVEEGTLRLSAYETPSPMRALFQRQGPQFALEDLRRSLLSRIAPLALPGASGDGEEGDALLRDDRERFDPTPVWLPRVTTDERGEARITMAFPDRAAGYRLFAVAIDAGGRAGSATHELEVRKAVVLEALAPRAVYAGDRYEATAVLHNTSTAAVAVALEARSDGRTLLSQPVALEPGAEARIAVPMEGTGARAALELRAVVDGVTQTAGASTVVLPTTRRSRTLRVGVVGRNGSIALQDLPSGLPSPRVTLALSTSPLLGLGAAVTSLFQGDDDGAGLASRVIGLAAASLVPAAWDGDELSPAGLRAEGERSLAALLTHQSSIGGFGEWSAEAESASTTLLAFEALLAAKRAGWTVAPSAMTAATARVSAMTRSEDGARETGLSIDERAWAAMLLRAAGATVHDVNTLHDRRDLMSPFGRGALALAMSPSDLRAASLVNSAVRQLEATRHGAHPGYRWYVGEARVRATLLTAATVHALDRVSGLAASLSSLRDAQGDGSWRDPMQTAAALDALARASLRCASDAPLRASVTLSSTPVRALSSSRSFARFRLSAAERSARLDVRSDVPLFFAVEAVRDVALGPAESVARGRGVSLHRTLETAAGEALADGATVRVGDLVRVRLFVHSEGTTPSVMSLRDPVGGGFEPVDQAFETTPRAEVMSLVGAGPDDYAMDSRVFHAMRSVEQVVRRSLRPQGVVFRLSEGQGLREFTFAVRAATPGQFVLPPATLDARFDPGVVARSTLTHLTVVR